MLKFKITTKIQLSFQPADVCSILALSHENFFYTPLFFLIELHQVFYAHIGLQDSLLKAIGIVFHYSKINHVT